MKIIYVLLLLIAMVAPETASAVNSQPFVVIAHRGASEHFPENTLFAFRSAIYNKAAMIEFDVQETKDGQTVIMHDETVDRTTNGTGRVDQMTLKEIKSLRAGSAIATVPTLSEVLQVVKSSDVKFIADNKTSTNEALKDYVEQIVNSGLINRATILVYSVDQVDAVRSVSKTVKICYTIDNQQQLDEALTRLTNETNDSICVYYKTLLAHTELLDQAKERGIGVIAYPVDDEDIAKKLVDMGLNGILTDDIKEMEHLTK